MVKRPPLPLVLPVSLLLTQSRDGVKLNECMMAIRNMTPAAIQSIVMTLLGLLKSEAVIAAMILSKLTRLLKVASMSVSGRTKGQEEVMQGERKMEKVCTVDKESKDRRELNGGHRSKAGTRNDLQDEERVPTLNFHPFFPILGTVIVWYLLTLSPPCNLCTECIT